MSRDRRSPRSDVPPRTPGQLVDALRDLAAEAEEPVLSPRRRFMRPVSMSGPAAAPADPSAHARPDTPPPIADEPDVDAQPGDLPYRLDEAPERDADEADVLWRRPAPARARRSPSRARRDPATAPRRPSAGAGRPRAELSPLRLGAGVLGAAVIVIIIASLLSGGSSRKRVSQQPTKAAASLPSATVAAPVAIAPRRSHHRAAAVRHRPRGHRTTSGRRLARHRHRHPATAAHGTGRHHKHRTRARHDARARRHRRPGR